MREHEEPPVSRACYEIDFGEGFIDSPQAITDYGTPLPPQPDYDYSAWPSTLGFAACAEEDETRHGKPKAPRDWKAVNAMRPPGYWAEKSRQRRRAAP